MKSVIKLATICLPLLFSGCFSNQPTTFYLLQAMDSDYSRKNEISSTIINVYIKPIKFPDYLDRPQMVFRENEYKLQLREYHRWAESLRDNFTKVLIENINTRIMPGRVITYAELDHTKVNFQLAIEVLRLDVDANNNAVLKVKWSLLEVQDEMLLQSQNNEYSVSLTDSSYEAGVAGQSIAIAEFTDQIVAIIRSHSLIQNPSISVR